ncbi:hypothetical protein ACMYR3_05345 [Ampullimonas aquatilis]|uniref:hypothetical protein n=1 Tax=Ampullimonas aquatilis TaxID=1341549 RepID=UPI003C708A8E
MYCITLACDGISPEHGSQVAADVLDEFRHRPWQQIFSCQWEGETVVLVGKNDFDTTGDALADEFSDAIAANWDGGYFVRIVNVIKEPESAA